MRIGFVLPQIGPAASPQAIVRVGQKAEALSFDSLWTTERLLYPIKPQTPYVATPDGSLPEQYKIVLDPLETLTFAAAHTKRIGLGTSDAGAAFDDSGCVLGGPTAGWVWPGVVEGRVRCGGHRSQGPGPPRG